MGPARLSIFTSAALLLASLTYADSYSEIYEEYYQRAFLFSANASLGYGGMTVPDGSKAPGLQQTGIGVTAVYGLLPGILLAGASSDYSFANQHTDTAASGANHRGHRFSIVSPTLGTRIGQLLFLTDIEFLGSYDFSIKASNGGDVSLKSPKGGKLKALYPIWESVLAGLQLEYLSFSKIENSVSGEKDLSKARNFWQISLAAGYFF